MGDFGTAMILTCKEHRHMADLCVAGIEKYWTGVSPLVVMDTDRETESDVPDDIRDTIRRVPYLRRIFDLPFLSPTEQVYIIDSDCLVYSDPTDFGPNAYQAVNSSGDDSVGVDIWRSMGIEFNQTRPRFCGGCYSAQVSMFRDGLDLAIEYTRRCMRLQRDKTEYPGVVCEQSLAAGLWRQKYPDCQLDPLRYPLIHPTDEMVIYHVSCGKRSSAGKEMFKRYEESL